MTPAPSPVRRNRLMVLTFWGVPALFVVLGLYFSSGPPELIEKSRRVLRLEEVRTDYAWIDDNTVLLIKDRGDHAELSKSTLQGRNTVIDIPPPVRRWVNSFPRDVWLHNCLSPSGTRLLWATTNGIYGFEMGGAHSFEEFRTPPPLWSFNIWPLWTRDSDAWLDVRENAKNEPSAALRDANTNRAIKTWVHAPQGLSPGVMPSRDRVVTAAFWAKQPPMIVVSSFRLGSQISCEWNRMFPLPRGTTEVREEQLSRSGERLALLLQFEKPKTWFQRLVRKLGIGQDGTDKYSAVWTCRVDGSELHEIGRISADSYSFDVGNFQWTPDERSISYLDSDSLWTVPARN